MLDATGDLLGGNSLSIKSRPMRYGKCVDLFLHQIVYILCFLLYLLRRESQNTCEVLFVLYEPICFLKIASVETAFNLVNKYNYIVSFKVKGAVI